MGNGEAFILYINLLGLSFLIFYGWYVLIQKNDPGVVGLTLSAIISVQLISTILEHLSG